MVIPKYNNYNYKKLAADVEKTNIKKYVYNNKVGN